MLEIPIFEEFRNKWFTRKDENTIIKHSNDSQLAFKFSAEKDIDKYFKKIQPFFLLLNRNFSLWKSIYWRLHGRV